MSKRNRQNRLSPDEREPLEEALIDLLFGLGLLGLLALVVSAFTVVDLVGTTHL